MRRIRSVTPAAAASAIRGSWLGYTMRSIVPSVENPRASARLAHSSSLAPHAGDRRWQADANLHGAEPYRRRR